MTSEPVLVIAFNRPDLLRVLLDRLRLVGPTNVFVAIDGPRPTREGEAGRVQECRDLVASIDWPCEVNTNFQERNLGCGLGVSTAISWFFEHVERGIILEDDIIPDLSFFAFCTELLDRYQDDRRVFAIAGCNFAPKDAVEHPEHAYRFSQIPHIWGWATWRRSWQQHQLDISGWRSRLPIRTLWSRVGHSVPATVYWTGIFELLARKQVDTWDGQFVLASMASQQLTATSNVNLIQNIGFGETATHTVEDRHELTAGSVLVPTAPVPVVVDRKADEWTRVHHFNATWRGMIDQLDGYRKQRQRRKS